MSRKGSVFFARPVLAAAGVLAVGAAAGLWALLGGSAGRKADPAGQAVYRVRRQDLTISVIQSGEIQARSYTDYVCEVEGRPSIVDIVREGTYISPEDVRNGRILVRLDGSEIQEEYTQQKILYANAEAALTEAREALEIQQKQNESDEQAALLAVKFARMDLEKYLSKDLAEELIERAESSPGRADQVISELVAELVGDPNSPRWGGAALQARRLLESNIKLARGVLKRDDNRLRGTKKLYEKQYVAASELESDQLARQRSAIDVQQAETAMALFLRYDLPKEVEKLFSEWQEARRQLERTRASIRAKLAQARAKLNSAQATFDLQKERREKLEAQLAACTIRATAPGLVIYGTSTNYEARSRDPIEIGDIVHKGQKIITIPNTSEVAAIVRVHESWVEKVHPGLPVRITADPFPDSVFSGRVETVAPLPDPQSRWMNTGLKVYTTYVSVDGKDHALRPGMSAKIEILIDRLENVLCVPLQAVATEKGLKLCYVVTPAGLEARPVETGQFNDSFVEIKSGLAEGEVVSLVPPRLSGPARGRQARPRGRRPPSRPAPAEEPNGPLETRTPARPATSRPAAAE